MVRNDGAPCRRLAGVRLVPALAIVLALGAIRAEGTLGAEDTREVFDILDDSHDSLITRQEFLRTKIRVFYGFLKIVDVDQHLDPEDIKITPEAFAEADLNDDGKMTGAEFVQAPFSQFRRDQCERRPGDHLRRVPRLYAALSAIDLELALNARQAALRGSR